MVIQPPLIVAGSVKAPSGRWLTTGREKLFDLLPGTTNLSL